MDNKVTTLTTSSGVNHIILNPNDFCNLIKSYLGDEFFAYLDTLIEDLRDYLELKNEFKAVNFELETIESELSDLENDFDYLKTKLSHEFCSRCIRQNCSQRNSQDNYKYCTQRAFRKRLTQKKN